MPAKVFISYRRDDSAGHAGRVHDRLEREFGRDLLFMDVDAMPLGMNFVTVLRDEVAKCDVLLAIIGPTWLDVKSGDGKRRLHDPRDFVRVEIATALQRDIPVVPVLLEGTPMPGADQLPEDLKELSLRNALNVRHASFHNDMDRLIQGLKAMGAKIAPRAGTSPEASNRMATIDLLIHSFFQPIKSRLQKDSAIWRRMMKDKTSPDSFQYKLASTVEREHIIPNHNEIVEIIEKNRHLVDDDAELAAVLNAYLDHVTVFKSIRSAGDDWTYPELMGAPWPQQLVPLIEARLQALATERNTLRG